MTAEDLSFIFNRAFYGSFSLKKMLFVFWVLALCGVLVVFFRGLALNVGGWLLLSLTFLPIFLTGGVLLSLGVMLIRIYHDEVKGKEVKYRKIFSKSWEVILGASYFTIPIILLYLVMWMALGIFVMLTQIPIIGAIFSSILSFGPFLLNFASLLLCVGMLAFLFFVSPAIALKGLNGLQLSHWLNKRFKNDPFANLVAIIIGVLPVGFISILLVIAAYLSGFMTDLGFDSTLYTMTRWFFMMIPFVFVLSPAIIFFFNFAVESHVLMKRAFTPK